MLFLHSRAFSKAKRNKQKKVNREMQFQKYALFSTAFNLVCTLVFITHGIFIFHLYLTWHAAQHVLFAVYTMSKSKTPFLMSSFSCFSILVDRVCRMVVLTIAQLLFSSMTNSFIFINCFILVRDVIDLEPILATTGSKWENSPWIGHQSSSTQVLRLQQGSSILSKKYQWLQDFIPTKQEPHLISLA